MATVPIPFSEASSDHQTRSYRVGEFLAFVSQMRERIRDQASEHSPEVKLIRDPVEDHYVDDSGKAAMYLRFESALYDDAPAMVTLWGWFDEYERCDLQRYRRMLSAELDGLSGDRHPRKIFDRSPIGFAALIAGTITLWMSALKTFGGQDHSKLLGLLDLIQFNWIVGTMWVGGLFVVVWYIVRTHRNNCQVATLSTIARALDLYLHED